MNRLVKPEIVAAVTLAFVLLLVPSVIGALNSSGDDHRMWIGLVCLLLIGQAIYSISVGLRLLKFDWLKTVLIPERPEEEHLPPAPKYSRRIIAAELQSEETRKCLNALQSQNESDYLQALQILMHRLQWPVGQCEFYPIENCTRLQFVAAEVLFREWLEIVLADPNASEHEIIEQMFPAIQPQRRYRKLAEIKRDVAAFENALEKRLDRLSDAVKDTILDMMPDHPEPRSDKDVLLAPLPRETLIAQVRPKFEEALEHVADALGSPKTEEDLIRAEAEIHPFLSNLRWAAIATALDLRLPQGSVTAQDVESRARTLPTRTWSTEKPEQKPDESWVKKFRRMRAAGLQ